MDRSRIIVGSPHRTATAAMAALAASTAGAQQEPPTLQELEAQKPELTEEQIGRTLALISQMNEALVEDQPLKLFLWRLNMAVIRAGTPVPRTLCMQYGVEKSVLQKLVKKGFLKEYHMRHKQTRQVLVGYTLADDVTFNEHMEVIRMVPEEQK